MTRCVAFWTLFTCWAEWAALAVCTLVLSRIGESHTSCSHLVPTLDSDSRDSERSKNRIVRIVLHAILSTASS
jgi:hypothetical protein